MGKIYWKKVFTITSGAVFQQNVA